MTERAAGRKTLCDDALIERMAQRVRDGLRYEAAIDAEGISRRTGANWQTWAEAGEEPYCALMQAVTRARAGFEASLLDSIRTQSTQNGDGPANEDWKARAWLLERTMPEQYAPTLALVVKARTEARDAVLDMLRGAPYPLTSFAALCSYLGGEGDDDSDDDRAEH